MKLHIPSPFGAPCEPGRAPDVVSKAVASLPPEQMFQLMQQMKMCIQNNPHEARTMLLQNPQLAYAVLQAQVVMKIVDPETAITMLHKPQAPTPPVGVGYGARPSSLTSSGPPNFGPPFSGGAGPGAGGYLGGLEMGGPGPRMDLHGPDINNGPPSRSGMGGMGGMPGRSAMDPMGRMGGGGMPPQDEPRGPPRDPRSRDPRDRGNMGGGGGGGGMTRGGSMSRGGPLAGPGGPNMRPGPGGPGGPGGAPLNNIAGEDPEKAQLIMQVLQLTDDQIAVLPAEQRQSIMVLKEQIKQHGGPMM